MTNDLTVKPVLGAIVKMSREETWVELNISYNKSNGGIACPAVLDHVCPLYGRRKYTIRYLTLKMGCALHVKEK